MRNGYLEETVERLTVERDRLAGLHSDALCDVARLTAERDALRVLLARALASARPNSSEHPTMWAAWADIERALGGKRA